LCSDASALSFRLPTLNGDVKSPEEGVLTAASVRPATDVLPVVRIRATRSWFDLELRALGA